MHGTGKVLEEQSMRWFNLPKVLWLRYRARAVPLRRELSKKLNRVNALMDIEGKRRDGVRWTTVRGKSLRGAIGFGWQHPLAAAIAAWVATMAFLAPCMAEPIDFNRDIRPLLAQHCTACHGGVKAAGDLSFIYRERALSAMEPGDPENSELMRRVRSTDPEEMMPKPGHGRRLTDDEIAKLEQWIQEGAPWSDTWSSVLPTEPPLPTVKQTDWPVTDADRFILAQLESQSMTPSAAASDAEWFRRVSLDLIGLPPTWERWQQYQQAAANDRPAARRQWVDELLASKHFGERWAAMWLDLARYSDTFGFEKDPHRDIWQWRDWVIQAFNQDMPYDQFTIKQLAGDLLENPEPGDLIATAFHRNTQNNTEGGTDDEEFRMTAVMDRVNTTWVAWQATTFGCVRCHSHPYEPYAHDSYYRFLALFNNTDDCDQNDDYPHTRVAQDPSQQAKIVAYEQSIRRRREKLNEAAKQQAKAISDWQPLVPEALQSSGGELSRRDDGRIVAMGTLPVGVSYQLTTGPRPFTAIRLQIYPDSNDPTRWPERGAVLSHATATWILPDGQRQPIALKEVVADAIDGPYDPQASLQDDAGGFGGYPVLRGPRWCILVTDGPAVPPEGAKLELGFKQSAASNSGTQACTLRNFTLETSNDPQWTQFVADPSRQSEWKQWKEDADQLAAIPVTQVPTMRELSDAARRSTRIFVRGNMASKGDAVEPGLPELFRYQPPGGRPMNRLDLARWLVSDDNPLASRVLANRLWAELFGRGLVETLEDFGTSGTPPTHPELLDHLALRLSRTHQWSIKSFLRELVLSATYSQTSQGTPMSWEHDPQNRLYGRGPRARLTAEMIRDQALVVSGLFSPKQFGPPVFPPQPDGVWSTVYSGAQWTTSTGEDRYRRAIYTYCRRTSGYPAMLAFDAPSRDVCAARRIPTNTPLQALVALNDPAFIEMAQAFAKRMNEHAGSPTEKLTHGYRQLLLEDPPTTTLTVLEQLYQEALAEYQASPSEAAKLAESPEMAALVLAANTMLNLDAALVR